MTDQPGSSGEAAAPPKIASAGGSMLAARIASQVAQLALFVAAARVLNPSDFGVFTLIVAVSNLLLLLASAGWREFILGWRGDENGINQALIFSILAGLGFGALGALAAFALAVLGFGAVISILTLILSAYVALCAPGVALSAVLVRKGAVGSFSAATIIGEFAGLAFGLYGLFAGWGVLALGASKLGGQIVNLVIVAAAARWPLRLTLAGGSRREILDFSREILASRIIGFVSNNASTFVIGAFLGVASVGYYRAAERVVSAVAELVFEPLRLIAWMAFRHAADGANARSDVIRRLTDEAQVFLPMTLLIAGPAFVGLAIVAEDLIVLCLGETWAPAAPIAVILAIAFLFLTPSVATEPLLTVTGRIQALPPVSLFNACVSVAVILAFTPFGAVSTAIGRLIAYAVAMGTSFWLQVRHARTPWLSIMRRAAPVYGALAVMLSAVFAARAMLPGEGLNVIWRLAADVGVGALAYVGSVALIQPSYVRAALLRT
ncbi:MAG: oligosaccharide flippase family protein [Pseudomonadota bacterium]